MIARLTVDIRRGDRIGVMGPNGCGKTTLLKLLLGDLVPSAGTVTRGANLQVAYFDQLRAVLDPLASVWENVAPGGGDTVFVNGAPRHVISYLRDFLFTADRAKSPVRQLSGGERSRLLLARIFAQPANVLVFDEPTNDLDTETLELLEELLTEYQGTVLIVSHDREFLNNVVTTTLAFEGDGLFKEYVGGYDDWERQKAAATAAAKPPEDTRKAAAPQRRESAGPRKLSYREQQELLALPARIEALEHEANELNTRMADPVHYRKPGFVADARARVAAIELELAVAFKQWEELEGRSG